MKAESKTGWPCHHTDSAQSEMTHWIYIDLIVLAFVILVTGTMIPQILRMAFRKNLFDTPDQRKIHKTDIPRLGGLAFVPSILLGMLLLYAIGSVADDGRMLNALTTNRMPLCCTALGAVILYATGIVDDLVGVRYSAKFLIQSIAAALVIIGGLTIDNLDGFCWMYELPFVVSVLLTGLFIVFVINAINLIDGVDGLASGLGGVACAFYALVFLNNGLYVYSALAAATLGTMIPFFGFNVFGNSRRHTKIFMGDTGALVLGLILSVLSIKCFSIKLDPDAANPAVIAIAPLLIPGFDVVRVYMHRLRAGRNPFLPDKTHIHHKLLALGLGQKRVMLIIVSVSIALVLLNYLLSPIVGINVLFLMDLTLWIVMNTLLTSAIRQRERRSGTKLYV